MRLRITKQHVVDFYSKLFSVPPSVVPFLPIVNASMLDASIVDALVHIVPLAVCGILAYRSIHAQRSWTGIVAAAAVGLLWFSILRCWKITPHVSAVQMVYFTDVPIAWYDDAIMSAVVVVLLLAVARRHRQPMVDDRRID